MSKYAIQGLVAADKHIGYVEADTAADAIDKAYIELDVSTPNVCHQCSKELNVGDVYKLQAQNTEDDDDFLEEENPGQQGINDRIAALEEALKPFAIYAEKRKAQPLLGLGNTIHLIHPGTEHEAELTMEHCEKALALFKTL